MFEDLQRELKKLSQPRKLEILFHLDDKGFFDRECPGAECGSQFKVLFEDWKQKVKDEKVFCPFCRHEAIATEWNTPEQTAYINSAAQAEMTRLFQGALRRGVERSRPKVFGGGVLKMSMSLNFKPGSIPPVIVAKAGDTMRQDFVCEACGCRFASIGASFFCPACGQNCANSSFDTTMDTVEKTIHSLTNLELSISETVDADVAKNAVRQLLEDQFARCVGAFERINETLFEKLPNASSHTKKGMVFQRLDEANTLWNQATGMAYSDFISSGDLNRMKFLFQKRHVFSHRQGIVDQHYIDKSGDRNYRVDQRLVAKASEVLELVAIMRKLIAGLRSIVRS